MINIESQSVESWEMKAEMKQARANFSTCVINNLVYVFGGISGAKENYKPIISDSVEVFDLLINVWSEIRIKNAP